MLSSRRSAAAGGTAPIFRETSWSNLVAPVIIYEYQQLPPGGLTLEGHFNFVGIGALRSARRCGRCPTEPGVTTQPPPYPIDFKVDWSFRERQFPMQIDNE